MKKKILIIGTGSIAKRHVTNILKLKQSVTLNLFSKSEKRAKNFISNFKGKKISLLNSSELKKKKFTHIIIASKTTLHNKYIFDFYKVCENIFCEKPLPIDRFTKSLIRICKNKINGEKIKIGFQFRFNPAIQFMKKELKKKENKKVFLIKFSCGQNLKDWRNNKNYRDLFSAGNSFYGSVIWELCHDIDTLQYIFRKPNKVFSKLTNSNLLKVDTDDISISTLKFKNCDTNCTISLEMLSPVLYRNLIVISLNNYYEVDLIKNVIIKKNKNKISKYFFKTNRNFMFETLIKNFISNKNKSKKFDHATLIDGIFVSKVVNKMYISNKKNKFISI